MPPADRDLPGPIAPGRELTPEEIAGFREHFERIARGPVRILYPDGKARRRLPLPWRTRARLRARRAVDSLGAWLCAHGHEDAALRLWRQFGMIHG